MWTIKVTLNTQRQRLRWKSIFWLPYLLYSVKMKNTEKGSAKGLKSPSREKSSNPYDKQSFGEGNIYSNTYRDTSKSFIGIYKIFLRWKGSVYRLVWHDLILFMAAYFILLIIYRVVLSHFPTHKQHFELMCIYAHRFSSAIPITFLTGFYVSSVVSRWWDQFMSLPYPDQLALKLVAYVPGNVSWVDGPQIYSNKYYRFYISLSFIYKNAFSELVPQKSTQNGNAVCKSVIYTGIYKDSLYCWKAISYIPRSS